MVLLAQDIGENPIQQENSSSYTFCKKFIASYVKN